MAGFFVLKQMFNQYEFDLKVYFRMLPKSNVVVDVNHCTGNPHDSKNLETIIPNHTQLIPNTLKNNIVNRRYKGKKKIGTISMVIPNPKEDSK